MSFPRGRMAAGCISRLTAAGRARPAGAEPGPLEEAPRFSRALRRRRRAAAVARRLWQRTRWLGLFEEEFRLASSAPPAVVFGGALAYAGVDVASVAPVLEGRIDSWRILEIVEASDDDDDDESDESSGFGKDLGGQVSTVAWALHTVEAPLLQIVYDNVEALVQRHVELSEAGFGGSWITF